MSQIRVKQRIFSGAVCEQIVYSAPGGARRIKNSGPKPRFTSEDERAQHRKQIALKRFVRMVNATFSPESLYSTLTLDVENEVHTFQEARRLRAAYVRRLKHSCPGAQIVMVMGRGKHTDRIHYHMISNSVPVSVIRDKWRLGEVLRIVNLREHNYYDGVDHGRDYTGLAVYLFEHWTEEQGGHRYYATRNMRKPVVEDTKEALIPYSVDRPPRAPKGYALVASEAIKYGYLHFTYVAEKFLKKQGRGKK